MRLFFALWPDETTRARLAALQGDVKGRKTKPGNLHLTLAFLGEQADPALPALHTLLQQLTVPGMRLTVDHVAYRKRQRMVWAGLHDVPESLLALQGEICTGLDQCGIAFDRRNRFTPHITLARDALPAEPIPFEPIAWHACQVSLVQSVTEATGVIYKVLASQYCKEARDENGKDRA